MLAPAQQTPLLHEHTGGLAVLSASAVLEESTIADCKTSITGGGLYANQANVTIKGGSHIMRSTGGRGGGMCGLGSNLALLEDSFISDCYSSTYAGGLHPKPSCTQGLSRPLKPRHTGAGPALEAPARQRHGRFMHPGWTRRAERGGAGFSAWVHTSPTFWLQVSR